MQGVVAYYTNNAGFSGNVALTNTSGQNWSGSIPVAPGGTQVDWYIIATDNQSRKDTSKTNNYVDQYLSINASPTWTSVTPELSMATSVPVPIAIPTCACASAGASAVRRSVSA
jgi:hypothetical protein